MTLLEGSPSQGTGLRADQPDLPCGTVGTAREQHWGEQQDEQIPSTRGHSTGLGPPGTPRAAGCSCLPHVPCCLLPEKELRINSFNHTIPTSYC